MTLLGPGVRSNQGANLFFAILMLSVVTACSAVEKASDVILPKTPPSVLFSAIVADEPTAVLAARDVLARGGTAADAAVGLYFTLAITYPSQAGLGGAGICMVYEPQSGRADVLDFSPARAGSGRDAVAIPTIVRGMAWLHARFGRLSWSSLLGQSASSAREGVTTSRALITDLKSAAPDLANDATALSLFFDRLGEPIGEGIIFQQIELGAVLGHIGARGGGVFYRGALAKRIVSAAAAQGQPIDARLLSKKKPKWLRAQAFKLKDRTIYFPPTGGGKAAANLWMQLSKDASFKKLDGPARTSRLATAAKSSQSNFTSTSAKVGSGFTVVDGTGLAVVCSVTASRKFGTGKFLPGLGFALAPAPGEGEFDRQPMTPILAVDRNEKKIIFAASGNGGPGAASATVGIAARTLLAGERLAEASDRPRILFTGDNTPYLAEKAVSKKELGALVKENAKVERVPSIGRINAIYCPAGLPPDSRSDPPCQVKADKRGNGVGARFKKDLRERR
ncbi:MAG: hypothetical protein CMM48_01800 [Rhodospirillaceae bacterium]|nr:hypothetical protein [Rhodospirillaceae bacterium]